MELETAGAPRFSLRARVAAGVIVLAILLLSTHQALAQGCRSGANALANAYVRTNPIYAIFFGDLPDYVALYPKEFAAGSSAVQCAHELSKALMTGAIKSFDTATLRMQQELNSRLGAMGISPGQQHASPSAQLYAMSQRLSWLARVLPAAAGGNYNPMHTPQTEEEQLRLFSVQMLGMLLEDPSMRSVFLQQEYLIKEAANVEYRLLLEMAARH